jgi:uncharacterized damage-inducible protein DinB
MANLDLLYKAWDVAQWEFSLVFEGLPDEEVWKRPHPRLLSIGELAGHVAYWDAMSLSSPATGSEVDVSQLPIQSPLIDRAFHYYTTNEQAPVTLPLSADQVAKELQRVHEAVKAQWTSVQRDSEEVIPGTEKFTYGDSLEYRVFHLAYHAGQAYSVRHLLGHTTTDN